MRGDDLPAAFVPELDGAHDLFLGSLLRAGFHHHDAIFGASHHDVELGLAAFVVRRIGDVLRRSRCRHARRARTCWNGISEIARAAPAPTIASELGSCSGSAESTMAMTCVSFSEAFRKQRADGPVDQAAGENLFFRGTALAFDKAAGNLSGGIGVFTIVNREREKAAPGLGSSAAHAVTSTTESPERTTTAPFACLAILPVSRVA